MCIENSILNSWTPECVWIPKFGVQSLGAGKLLERIVERLSMEATGRYKERLPVDSKRQTSRHEMKETLFKRETIERPFSFSEGQTGRRWMERISIGAHCRRFFREENKGNQNARRNHQKMAISTMYSRLKYSAERKVLADLPSRWGCNVDTTLDLL